MADCCHQWFFALHAIFGAAAAVAANANANVWTTMAMAMAKAKVVATKVRCLDHLLADWFYRNPIAATVRPYSLRMRMDRWVGWLAVFTPWNCAD